MNENFGCSGVTIRLPLKIQIAIGGLIYILQLLVRQFGSKYFLTFKLSNCDGISFVRVLNENLGSEFSYFQRSDSYWGEYLAISRMEW